MQHGTVKSVQDTDHSPVAGNENLFPVVAEFDSSPFTHTAEPCLKGGKGALQTERTITLNGINNDVTIIGTQTQSRCRTTFERIEQTNSKPC